jgi:hypothetical protein
MVFNGPDGKRIGCSIALPERSANLCFGGRQAQPPVHGGEPLALFAFTSRRRARPKTAFAAGER